MEDRSMCGEGLHKLTGSLTLQTHPAKNAGSPPQVMRLDLGLDIREDLLKELRKPVHISFGKIITLHYGNKSKQLLSTALPFQNEFYTYSEDKPDELVLSGLLSHQLTIKRPQHSPASTDTALEALQNSIASHQKSKQSKQIKFVADATDLPPSVRGKPLAMKQKSASRTTNGTTRSMSPSPATGASRSPEIAPPTSAPIICDGKTQKLQALRTPLIHLLAVRQVSAKFVSQKTCCSEDECNEVLNKVGQKHNLDKAKWNLTDKSYKNLDVWAFPYPTEIERQVAIDHAVAAFDRMRISREEHVWQMLLPKDERGKGKILSKLNLHSGPLAKSTTPRINVQATDDSAQGGHETGNDIDKKDRLGPSDAHPMALSKSQDQITKIEVSEMDAQSEGLLKNSKKTAAPKPRETPSTNSTHPMARSKSQDQIKKASEREAQSNGLSKNRKKTPAPKPRETQSAVKRGSKKSTPKSTEFVHESDEDEDMIDVGNKPTPSTSPPNEGKRTPKVDIRTSSYTPTKPRISESKGAKTQKKSTAPLHKTARSKPVAPNASIRNKFSDSGQSSAPKTRTSPHKPSPLGSSPPTNASDLSSTTPLITQSRMMSGTNVPINARTSPQVAPKATESPIKRKADKIEANPSVSLPNGQDNPVKRHRAPMISPPPPDNNNSTTTTSKSSSPPSIRSSTIDKAVQFKTYYSKYEKFHHELSERMDRSEADIKKLYKMHNCLAALKDDIWRESRNAQSCSGN